MLGTASLRLSEIMSIATHCSDFGYQIREPVYALCQIRKLIDAKSVENARHRFIGQMQRFQVVFITEW